MQSLLGRFGGNFIVSSFIPALGFVVTGLLIFDPILPSAFRETFKLDWRNSTDGLSLLPFVLTILIGFTLMGLNVFVYKLLEGYTVLERIRPWRDHGIKKSLKRQLEFELIDKTILNLRKKQKTASVEERAELTKTIKLLDQRSYNLKAAYQQDYPPQANSALPTSFGNILKAAEVYSLQRYGIDAVTMWPRLIYVMDPTYYKKVDQSHNGLAFVVNSLMLTFILSLFCLLVSGYQFSRWQYAENQYTVQLETCEGQNKSNCEEDVSEKVIDLFIFKIKLSDIERREYHRMFWMYLILSPFFLAISIFFYYASLPAARQYGNMIRSSYDLFRFNLVEQLRLTLPPDSDDEYQHWTKWSEFVALGSDNLAPFSYQHPKTQNEGKRVFKEEAQGTVEPESTDGDVE